MRSDDGVGPWLAAWAEERFSTEPAVRVISRQQWTPDLAEEIACSAAVLFIDCAVDTGAGAVRITAVEPAHADAGLATHRIGAAELLALTEELYGSGPRNALLMTVGAGSTEFSESFSPAVRAALPEASRRIENMICGMLEDSSRSM